MQDIKQTASDLLRVSNYMRKVLSKADEDRIKAQRQLWEQEGRLDQVKSGLPWFGLGAAVLVLVLTVMLPRFLVSYGPICAVIGGAWTTTSTSIDVCAFYRE